MFVYQLDSLPLPLILPMGLSSRLSQKQNSLLIYCNSTQYLGSRDSPAQPNFGSYTTYRRVQGCIAQKQRPLLVDSHASILALRQWGK